VQRRLKPDAVGEVGGFLGDRLRLNVENRLHTFDIERFVRMVEAKQYRDWFWIGEQPWKWLEAALYAAALEPALDNAEVPHETRLRPKAEQVLRRLVAAQEPDGYVGITHKALRNPLRGMDAYELYFALHALISAYELWQSDEALTVAKRLADYFVNTIGPGKAEFRPTEHANTIAGHSVHFSLEGTLLIDPMARLAQVTRDERYLKWCEWCVANIDRWSGHDTFTNLQRVAAGEIGLHEIQPNVHSHTLHMNLLGFLRLYELTGDRTTLEIAEAACREIRTGRTYLNGGVSVGESYHAPHVLPNGGRVCETCATMSYFFLNLALLELTGDAVYADVIETLTWNMVTAPQTHDGKGWRYNTPPNGTKPFGYFTGPDCCSASGPRLLTQTPTAIYGVGEGGLYVNQYVESVAHVTVPGGPEVLVEQATDYPAGERIRIILKPADPATFAVNVRLPRWCQAPSIRAAGKPFDGTLTPGTYVRLHRTWKAGDTIVLTLPMQPRWIEGTHSNEGLTALVRGPVVYCLDTIYSNESTRLALAGMDPAPQLKLIPGLKAIVRSDHLKEVAAPHGALGPYYECEVVLTSDQKRTATLVPFAGVGRYQRPGSDEAFRPEPRYPFAVWMPYERQADRS